jgi:hypothetical protein
VRALLDSDPGVRRFFDRETTTLPEFYRGRIRRDLGPLWAALPAEGLQHDQNAYLNSQAAEPVGEVALLRRARGARAGPAQA